MTNPNDPAFIRTHVSDRPNEYGNGLTKREYFAGMAMQGLLCKRISEVSIEDLALLAIVYSDALIAELNKEPSK